MGERPKWGTPSSTLRTCLSTSSYFSVIRPLIKATTFRDATTHCLLTDIECPGHRVAAFFSPCDLWTAGSITSWSVSSDTWNSKIRKLNFFLLPSPYCGLWQKTFFLESDASHLLKDLDVNLKYGVNCQSCYLTFSTQEFRQDFKHYKS